MKSVNESESRSKENSGSFFLFLFAGSFDTLYVSLLKIQILKSREICYFIDIHN